MKTVFDKAWWTGPCEMMKGEASLDQEWLEGEKESEEEEEEEEDYWHYSISFNIRCYAFVYFLR